jgi:uncharacterized protein
MVRPRTCPICHKDVPVLDVDAPHRPFCSPRCKQIDFGSWLDGGYRISRALDEDELDAASARAVEQSSESGKDPDSD